VLLKAILIILLGIVFIQDYKNQLVSWYLFPLIALLFGINFYEAVGRDYLYLLYSIMFNLCLILIILLLLSIYSNLKMKRKFINNTFGLGDVFMLLSLALGFPSYTFIILLVMGILFALGCYLLLKANYEYETIPLAGYLSLFFAIILLSTYLPFFPSVYLI
jgi:hypothetical protein